MRELALADRAGMPPVLRELFDPDVIYTEDPRWPGTAVYRGIDAVDAAFRGYVELLTPTRYEIESVTAIGDSVVATVLIAGTTRETGVPFEHVWTYVGRVREGRISEFQAYYDSDEAIAAAESRTLAPGAG